MHTTWRAAAGHGLLAAAFGTSLLIAVASGSAGAGVGWQLWLYLALPVLIGTGLFLLVIQHRRGERFRRHLARGLTHHLRTSLAHVRAYNEMLLLGREKGEAERQAWLEVVGREAERLASAVENVLLILGGSSSDIHTTRRPVDLGALLEDVASAHRGGSSPRVDLGDGPPVGIMVSADPRTLEHAIANLLDGLGRCCSPDGSLSAALFAGERTATVQIGLTGSSGPLPGSHWALRDAADHPDACTGIGFGLELVVVEHIARMHGGRAGPFVEAGRTGYRLQLPVVSV